MIRRDANGDRLLWGLSVLATYRLVRLAIEDTIFDDVRDVLYPNLARGGVVKRWFLALITCPWCLGVWLAGIVTLGVVRDRSVFTRFVWWMSVAAIQPWVHMVEGILHSANEAAEEFAAHGPIVYNAYGTEGSWSVTPSRLYPDDEDNDA